MKTTGIIRQVDGLGRIVLPIELRRSLDIQERDQVEILLEGDHVILKKHETNCIFCGGVRGLMEYKGKILCRDCTKHLSHL